jgi:hypothetical protein
MPPGRIFFKNFSLVNLVDSELGGASYQFAKSCFVDGVRSGQRARLRVLRRNRQRGGYKSPCSRLAVPRRLVLVARETRGDTAP